VTSEITHDVLLAVQGDRTAYGRIVRAYGPKLASTLGAYGVANSDVEDVVQEAFLAAWRALGDYDRDRPFKSWLFQIALNKARDWRRKRYVRRFFHGAGSLDASDAQALPSADLSPEDAAHDRRLTARVGQAVQDLPEDLKRAFVLTVVSEMTYAEASAALGITPKSVEGRLMRARRLLQPKLASLRAKD
jgi:RNA polymerase sigma-70 factor (ECF subfamily)